MKTIRTTVMLGGCLLTSPAWAVLVDGSGAPLAIPAYFFQGTEDGAVNPSYTFTDNNPGGYGALSVSYAAYFEGQTASDPLSPPASVTGPPIGPLALSLASDWQAVVQVDNSASAPNTEVLGGVPAPATNGFGGPLAILFSQGVTGLQLTAGFLDTIGSTTIEAFTADGTSLGTVSNTSIGYETFNLSDSDLRRIEGVLITSTDPAGFGIDGVGVQEIPAPGALALLPGFVAVWLSKRRTRAIPAS